MRELNITIVAAECYPNAWACIERVFVPTNQNITNHASHPTCCQSTIFRDAITHKKGLIRKIFRQWETMFANVPCGLVFGFARIEYVSFACLLIQRANVVIHARQRVLQPSIESLQPLSAFLQPCLSVAW